MTPDGARWTVKRLWWPRRRARRDSGWDDVLGFFPDVGPVDDFAAGLVVLALVAAIAVLVVFFLPEILLLLELLVLPLVFAYKVVFRRPWVVEAKSDGAARARWRVPGWRRSGEFAADVARRLERGASLPTDGDSVSRTA